ncbi:MAG TPA: phage tail protein [Kofleriaceae bacterium]
MADLDPQYPFRTFNFAVEIQLPNVNGVSQPLCSGAFSECDGLEISFDVKTIREGGNNSRQIRLAGPSTMGTLSLKRGMAQNTDLWTWVASVQQNPGLRAEAVVVMYDVDPRVPISDRDDQPVKRDVVVRFVLSRCLPVKIKAPALNAKDGLVAIEELQVAYESLEMRPPHGGQGG